MAKTVGYYFWGFLGDKKFDESGHVATFPDGNAFYSWSIINELQNRGDNVVLFNDRDKPGYLKLGSDLFKTFAKDKRNNSYTKCTKYTDNIVKLSMSFDYVIIEWRWKIPGRNDNPSCQGFQPDFLKMEQLINYCNSRNIPVVIFDLDYKLTGDDIRKYKIKYVIELGNKWKPSKFVTSKQVKIPFDFSEIKSFKINNNPTANIIYVGNEYERNWAIKKYLPDGSDVYGNWLEPSHIHATRELDTLNFHSRINLEKMPEVYNNSIATVLLAKSEYCTYGFMTARLIESIFYGTVPFFICEFSNDVIQEYAGQFADFLTVHDKKEVEQKTNELRSIKDFRYYIIDSLRDHLQFMDSKYFINDVQELLQL